MPGVTDTGNHTDDGSTLITLPFSFNFYGVSYSSADVGSNGLMAFGGAPNNSFTTSCLPAVAASNLHLFPFWVDQTTAAPGKGIYTLTAGTAPNRILYIEWPDCLYGTPTSCLANGDTSYEVILREGSSNIEVVYGTMGSATGTTGERGVQKDPSTYTQYSCNSGASAGQRLTYTPSSCGGATNTPIPTNTPLPPSATATATRTNTVPPTPTQGGPSFTPTRTNTPQPTNTGPPTNTPAPTNTVGPSPTTCACGVHGSSHHGGDYRTGCDRYRQPYRRRLDPHHTAVLLHLLRCELFLCGRGFQRVDGVRRRTQ